MKPNLTKTDGIINWSDDIEMSDELDIVCEHEHMEHGKCEDCGITSTDLYDDIYHAEGSEWE